MALKPTEEIANIVRNVKYYEQRIKYTQFNTYYFGETPKVFQFHFRINSERRYLENTEDRLVWFGFTSEKHLFFVHSEVL